MRALKIIFGIALLLLISGLVIMIVDASISLTYSRAHNDSLKQKCRQLSALATEGLVGKSVKDLMNKQESSAIVKIEGTTLFIDDVVLRIKNEKVVEVVTSKTCGSP